MAQVIGFGEPTLTLTALEKFEGSPDWRAHLGDKEGIVFLFSRGNQVIAEIVLLHPDASTVHIYNFECRTHSQGDGTACINLLKQIYKAKGYTRLFGESVPDAMQFWSKHGAIFRELEEGVGLQIETLKPFHIML